MKTVNVSEAKARLSQLLDLVVSGEELIITRAGKPIAKLIPYHVTQRARKPGYWKGKVKIATVKGKKSLKERITKGKEQVFRKT